MSTIKFDIKNNLSHFISFYESSPDFGHFFRGLVHFYTTFQADILDKGMLGIQDIQSIKTSLHQYLNPISNRKEGKMSGRFFTPKSVCRFINNRALKNYNLIDNPHQISPKILDPSSGLGFFLIDMFFLQIKSHIDRKTAAIDLEDIISRLYGYEIDKVTRNNSINLFLSILGIVLTIHSFSTNFQTLKKTIKQNIAQQNFLHADVQFAPDIIVGNPPYIRVHKMDPKENSYLRNHFFTAHNDFDVYVCFFEKCLKALPKNGILGFITPEKYLMRKYARNLRLLLLTNTVPLEFVDVSRCRDIFEVFTYPLITIFRKSIAGLESVLRDSQDYFKRIEETNPPNTIHFIRTSLFSRRDQQLIHDVLDSPPPPSNLPSTIVQKVFRNTDFHHFFSNIEYQFIFLLDPIVNKLENRFRPLTRLANIQKQLFSGTPRSKYYHLVKDNIVEDPHKQDDAIQFIMSKNIVPFCIFWDLPVVLDRNAYQFPQYKLENSVFSSTMISNFQHAPKLIVKANSRNITAALDRVGYSFMGAYGLIWTSKFFAIEVISAILNSDLMSYYITKKYQSFMVNSRYLSVNSIMINDIPLPGRIDDTSGKFIPILPKQKYCEVITEIPQIVAEIENHFQLVQSTNNLEDQRKLKKKLYVSQINTKSPAMSTQLGEYSEIQTLLKRLNELIFDLYDIPQSIRILNVQKDGSI